MKESVNGLFLLEKTILGHRWVYSLPVPADGVKGKTWGPSTCHQRERGQIPLLRPAPRPGGIWSKSAPNLDKPRTVLSRPTHDIGNTTPTTPDSKSIGDKGDHIHTSTLQLFKSKVTAFALQEFKPFRGSWRNNSYPTNNASLTPSSVLVGQNRLSRSIGNISESHYDTVFSTESFVIAKGVSNNNSVNFSKNYSTLNDDTEKLLKD